MASMESCQRIIQYNITTNENASFEHALFDMPALQIILKLLPGNVSKQVTASNHQ
jgi:hypothetical protein